MHEASLHEDNCFLTLTYSDDNLPPSGGLVKKHFQLFMKRLRRVVSKKISFIHTGEYGDEFGRPHYHALIFGHDFADKRYYTTRQGNPVWTSEILDRLWRLGRCEIGSVTFQSAAYVGRYCIKKVLGPEAVGYYQKVDHNTGEIYDVSPEYLTVSTRPAIAKDWFAKFSSDVFPSDFLVIDGKKIKVPRYYDKLQKRSAAAALADTKQKRFRLGLKGYKNSTPTRLKTREVVKLAQLSRLKRGIT